ncbi:MAG: hypothetical protein KDA94_00650, partial [Acidimicrobiales bacterium]|nr:hypothetical protein [Acidimicrobiales bacterium]
MNSGPMTDEETPVPTEATTEATTQAPVPGGDAAAAATELAASPAVAEGAIAGSSTVFEVRDLSVLYSGFRAVKDVSIDIAKHEITAFIGPSGCGKTTVL